MLPTLFQPHGSPIGLHTWGLMVMLAFIAGCSLLSARAARVGIDPDDLTGFYTLVTFGGLFGSRLLHFLMAEPTTFFANPLVFFDLSEGGFAFYGGAIFSTVAGIWYARRNGIHIWKLADAAAPSLMLGLALGRLGCFFAGCCHGRACDVPVDHALWALPGGQIVTTDGFPFLALVFERGVGVGDLFDVPTFPTQLWESTGAFLLFAFLSWEWRRWRHFDGQVFVTLLLTYPILRSTIEGFRGDAVRGTNWFGMLSTSQVVSIPVLMLGLVLLATRARRGLDPEHPVQFVDVEA